MTLEKSYRILDDMWLKDIKPKILKNCKREMLIDVAEQIEFDKNYKVDFKVYFNYVIYEQVGGDIYVSKEEYDFIKEQTKKRPIIKRDSKSFYQIIKVSATILEIKDGVVE